MVKYVLDTEDELEIASWTKALLDLKQIQEKLGYPTKELITIGEESFTKTYMAVYPNKVCFTTNSHEKHLKERGIEPDIHVLGDVTINECNAPLQVHGNVFAKTLKLKHDFKPEKFINIGNTTIYCNEFNCDDITVSGTINIHAKKVISTELKANNFNVFGSIENCTFLNADSIVVHENLSSKFINGKNDDDIESEINKHFKPK